MNIQNKCIFASATTHGALVVLALFGAAFFSSPPPLVTNPPIQLMSPRDIEATLQKGQPTVQPPPTVETIKPAVAPTPVKPPEVKPPEVKPPPTPPEPVKVDPRTPPKKEEPEPVQVKVPDRPALQPVVKRPPTEPKNVIATEAKPQRNLTNKVVMRTIPNPAVLKAQKEAEDRAAVANQIAAFKASQAAAEARANRLNGLASGLRSTLDSRTSTETAGFDGETFVNYEAFVKEVYDRAWVVSPEFADNDAMVTVRVVINRSGKVSSARILERSSSTVMNKTVQRALDDVRFVAPFPEGAKDTERSFKIIFNLQSKRSAG